MSIKHNKIFCIGFNKTGTTSLHNFFKSCGLKSTHNTEWCHYSFIKNGQEYFVNQCYSDGEQSNFIQLERWFPDSLFLLNTRDVKQWLYSRVKHVMRHNENINLGSLLLKKKYGKMAKDFYSNESNAIRKWVIERELYHKQVRTHFNNNSRFIEVDVTKAVHWTENLTSFFDRNDFKYNMIKPVKPIHKNKRNNHDLANEKMLSNYFTLIDKLIE